MLRKEFMSHSSQAETDGLNPFGIIHCPGCELSWILEFVPECCPRCGAKVTDHPAQTRESLDRKLQQANLGLSFSQCLYCEKVIGGSPELWKDICPYCNGELKLIDNGKGAAKSVLTNFMKIFKSK